MNKELISAIREENWAEIRRIAFALPEEEKAFFKDKFTYHNVQEIYPETPKTHRYGANKEFAVSYAMMCICTNLKELAEVENRLDFGFYGRRYYQQKHLFLFLISQQAQAFIDFLHTPQGAYMAEGAQKMYIEYPNYLSFEMLLALYKEGLLPFNEEIFVKRMYAMEYHRTQEELVVQLLSQNPELATRVIPHTAKYIDYTLGSNLEWKKVFTLLCKKNYFPDKSFITSFIEVLLNPWKKNVLDMYCRWIEGLAPTEEELLPSQHTLFALLTLDKSSLINFAMKCIAQISTQPTFDFQAFADNFALCFTVPKIAKSQLIGVEILEKYYQKQAPTNQDYREQLAVLFTVPDTKLQEKVANLLITYFSGEGLAEVVAPYKDYLKGKAQELLVTLSPSENSENSQTACAARTLTPITHNLTPGKLLFFLGDCIREKSAATIDVFFDALVRLQDQIPMDYPEQVKPYLKQLLAREWSMGTMPLLYLFLDSWSNQSIEPLVYDIDKEWKEIRRLYKEEKYTQADKLDRIRDIHEGANQAKETFPYLFNKIARTLEKLKEKDTLPFLSTPTHEPFYIEAEILVNKLLQYEAQGRAPDLDDLIVACNRLLFKEVSAAAKEKAQQLKGDYAPAIQYYLGLTDEIQLNEALLPLWTQITRLKHPDEEFKVFENTQAKNILSVVKPFYIRYGWEKRTYANGEVGEEFTYHCNHYYKYGKDKSRPTLYNYYNANEGGRSFAQEAEYKLSLNPHYPDAILCAYIALWATMNEADQVRDMTLPLEAVLRYDLRVRHSGWLYIGACLLFEKRPSRDLAYEYICQAIAHGEDLSYLKTYLSQVLAWDYLPIPRFIEFLDRPNPPAVKAFGKEVVALYLEEVKKQDKLPRNHKKMTSIVTND